MSTTEIYVFKKDGFAEFYGEVQNSFRGAPLLWKLLEEKYLPPIFGPSGERMYRTYSLEVNEVWQLANDPRITIEDKIALVTTFDKCLVKIEHIPEVIKAFKLFIDTSLPEQANILQAILEEEDVVAVGWNQTSVNGDTWESYHYDEDLEENIPYNCLTEENHFWL